MNLRIKTTAFTGLNTQEFPQKYSQIINAILNAPLVFSNLPIPAANLTDSVAAMIAKTDEASDGGSRVARDERDSQRSICVAILFTLANYVLGIANQKETEEEGLTVIDLSKFTPSKISNTPYPPVPQVEGVKGDWTKNGGDALVEWEKPSDGVIFYQIEKCLTDPSSSDANWIIAGSTSRTKITLTDLPRLSRVWVRVIAYGKNATAAAPSDPAMCTIG